MSYKKKKKVQNTTQVQSTKQIDDYYSLDKILAIDAQYRLIIGERSNGKTFATIVYGIKKYFKGQGAIGYIRRWKDDYTQGKAEKMCDGIVESGVIQEITNGEWTSIKYKSMTWFLAKWDDDMQDFIVDDKPFMYGFSLTQSEHYKSVSYPYITTVIYDEFLTRKRYLPNEFVDLMNLLSTIIRLRTNVEIFMLANTVSKSAPYVTEMGLKHIKDMVQDTIDVYSYGDSKLKVALQYCAEMKSKKETSNVYFAFDNPELQMITSGGWEIALYPHKPVDFEERDIFMYFFIDFEGELLQCEIVSCDNTAFVFIHRKTTPIKKENTDIVFSDRISHKNNYIYNLGTSTHPLARKLGEFFKNDKVFYQDNEVGEIVHNYLNFCKTKR